MGISLNINYLKKLNLNIFLSQLLKRGKKLEI